MFDDDKISKQDSDKAVTTQRSQQYSAYHFAHENIKRLNNDRLRGSGAIITITQLDGKSCVEPVMIRDGLSDATIKAIQADLKRSQESMEVFKIK